MSYVGRSFIGRLHAAEDQSVAVTLGGRARLVDALEQLAHRCELPVADQTLSGAHVDRLGLQLEVLPKNERVMVGIP